jgi:adenylate cyclase
MMAYPSMERLTKAYLAAQTERTLATLNKIVGRDPIASGRVVPSVEDIAIHDGRRFDQATVMFLDICKFSARPAWTDEEQQILLQILSLFFTEMIRIVEDYDGVVEKNTGDGLMAYFVRGSDDAVSIQQRALCAALTMFSAADRLINPILRKSNLDVLHFRICLDHGPITIAKVGAARGFNGIVAIGTTANIASKMLSVADPNTILVGTKVLAGIPQSWSTQFLQFKTQETGWTYRIDGSKYAFWVYTGRWSDPIL